MRTTNRRWRNFRSATSGWPSPVPRRERTSVWLVAREQLTSQHPIDERALVQFASFDGRDFELLVRRSRTYGQRLKRSGAMQGIVMHLHNVELIDATALLHR